MSKKKITPNSSEAEKLAVLPDEVRQQLLAKFSPEQLEALKYDWRFWGRKNQIAPPGNWHILLACAGRGFGKTRMLSEWVREKALSHPGCRIGIVARTSADARDIIVMGESGILKVHAPHEMPEYKPSVRRLEWPNGSTALLFSADSPDQLRGFQCHYLVGDEAAAWPTKPDASGATAWSNAVVCARLGENPQIMLATTPKKTEFMRKMIDDSKDPKNKIIVVSGSTKENNTLSKTYIENLESQYGNSELAKQEIEGQMLEGAAGLVFTREMIENNRDKSIEAPRTPLRIIAVDPTVSAEPKDECGIVVIGVTGERDLSRRRAYVLDDRSLKAAPDVWAAAVVKAAEDWGVRHVVVERNQGGDMLRGVIHSIDPTLNVHLVTATKGKQVRAEPIVVAMQQGRVKFWHTFPELEDQMEYWDPSDSGYSPDRMDALVWGITAALVKPPEGMRPVQSRIYSAAGNKLPTGRGTGQARSHTLLTRRV